MDNTMMIPEELFETWSKGSIDDYESKLRAAYALNLCTVSVSHIIDSKDQYIMEQEYETIINNINLANMPDNQAVLDILKEIMNVITFFKIQEGNRAFIEEDYKQAVNNSLSKSLNIAGLIGAVGTAASGNFVKAGLAIASSVGIGYMNYRSGKKQALLDKRKAEWALQRSAIEQLNNLRVQLLETAWHITKEEGIEDSLRLSEKQISQYVEILKDTDDFRRLERLDFIKNEFFAYPPFWYQLGHTASLVAKKDNDSALIEYAKKCFAFCVYDAKTNLLRDDMILSACALEYAELLDEQQNSDCELIDELLDIAEKYSGNKNDILQICMVEYLRINNFNKAHRLLWKLINDGYDVNFNAEILSLLYYREYFVFLNSSSQEKSLFQLSSQIESNKETISRLYNKLQQRAEEDAYLIPLPDDGNCITVKGYLEQRKKLITLKKDSVIEQVFQRYVENFVRIILPKELFYDNELPDIGEDIGNWVTRQLKTLEISKRDTYFERIDDEPIRISLYYLLNDLFGCLGKFLNYSKDIETDIEEAINMYVYSKKNAIDSFEKELNEKNFASVIKIYDDFNIQELFFNIAPIIQSFYVSEIEEIESLNQIISYERELYVFAKDNDYNIPVIPYMSDYELRQMNKYQENKSYELDPTILGIDDLKEFETRRQNKKNRRAALIEKFNNNRETLVPDNDLFAIKVFGDAGFEQFVRGRVHNYKVKDIVAVIYYKENENDGFLSSIGRDLKNGIMKYSDKELFFTEEGVYWKSERLLVKYKDIRFGKKNKLILSGYSIDIPHVNKDVLSAVIEEIVDINSTIDGEDKITKTTGQDVLKKLIKRYTRFAAKNGRSIIYNPIMNPQIALSYSLAKNICQAYNISISKDDFDDIFRKKDIQQEGAITSSKAGAITSVLGTDLLDYCERNEGKAFVVDDFVNQYDIKAEIDDKELTLVKEQQDAMKEAFVSVSDAMISSVETLKYSAIEISKENEKTSSQLKEGWEAINSRYTDGGEEQDD